MKDKHAASAEEARLRTILDSMVEAVFVTDEKGRVVLTNQALESLSDEEMLGRRAKNVIKSKELKTAIRRARKQNEAAAVQLEVVIGGKLRALHAQVAPLPDGDGVVTVLHDVTSLRDADRMRRDFVANASHELRTPLTAIRGFAETLADGAIESPEVALRFVESILRHTLRLQRLVEDLTQLSQAESPLHDYETEEVDVRQLCVESASSLDSYAKKKGIRLNLDLPGSPLYAEISPRAIDHVLINLVENAIKYSPRDAEVRLGLRRDGDKLVLEVRDSGPGIAPQHHARIFERFYRVDQGRSRDEGGTGLGLSIVKNLVERLGGSIEVESEVDEGALFRVRLPLEADAED